MSASEIHKEDQKSDDLALSLEDLTRVSSPPSARLSSSWSSPPSYNRREAYEMGNLEAQAAPEQVSGFTKSSSTDPFNFTFFKPKKDARIKCLFALILLLVVSIVTLAAIFGIHLAHERHNTPLLQNTTISLTQTSIQISTLATTTIKSISTTQTSTLTSLLPNPTSVSKCWDLLQEICANTTQIPSDTSTGAFGDCKNVMGFFYCGVIQILEKAGEMIIPADESPICAGMGDFCRGITIGRNNGGSGGHSLTTKSTKGSLGTPVMRRDEEAEQTGLV